jgi:hypothetical protein
MIIFYYKLVDARNGKVMDVTSENYLGDVNESGFWNGIPVIVSDWVAEEIDFA